MIRYVLILYVFIGLSHNNYSQSVAKERFESNRLFELYQNLPQTCQSYFYNKTAGDFKLPNWKTQLYFNSGTTSQVSHLGFRLYPSSDKKNLDKSIEHLFLERYLLELILWNDDTLATNRMIADKVKLKLNGAQWNEPGFTSIKQISPILTDSISLVILSKKDSCYATLSNTLNGNKLEIIFRKNRQLLTSKDKIEYGLEVANALKEITVNKVVKTLDIDINTLKKEEKYWTKSNKSFYIIEKLNQDVYFSKDSNNIKLINSNEFSCESFTNQLVYSTYMKSNPKVQIEHRIYGNEIVLNYSVDYSSITKYFEDFSFYAGCEEKLELFNYATLILHNEQLNFVNILYVESDDRTLYTSTPFFKVKLYTGIPMDNVKNLYKNMYE
jgi:hypothetical protein